MTNKLVLITLLMTTLWCVPAPSQTLDRGMVEVNGFVAATADTAHVLDRSGVGGGFEVAYGLNHHLAVTGNYAISRADQAVFCITAPCPALRRNMHEFMGGVRLSLPTGNRFTPYVTGTVGGVKLTESSLESVKFAGGFGAGLDVAIKRRVGVLVDLRGVKPADYRGWLVRGSAGVFIRF